VLRSLEIRNFRTFSRLAIQRLGRVNLVVGKNNVGKTTLLEALRLYGSIWPARTANYILWERDEVAGKPGDTILFFLQSLFHGRNVNQGDVATIGPLAPTAEARPLRISVVIESERRSIGAGWLPIGPTGSFIPDIRVALDFDSMAGHFRLSATGEITFDLPSSNIKPPEIDPGPPFMRGATNPAGTVETARRWDRIALTEGEKRVFRALEIVAPIRAASFVEDARDPRGRIARVRVDGIPDPVPLAVLGDGVVRMFQIAVALEYAAVVGGSSSGTPLPENVFPILLIDEIDMGIHYTLHTDLWRFILRAARDLGIQVFATTHSWDCVAGFQAAAAAEPATEALLIRLEAHGEKSRAVTFSDSELEVVTRENIEVR